MAAAWFGRSCLYSNKILTSPFRSTKHLSSVLSRYINGYTAFKDASSFKQFQDTSQFKKSYFSVLSRSMCSVNKRHSIVEDLRSSPSSAIFLGFSGAIPFCSLAGLSLTSPAYLDTIMHAQCAYGACILTFLGAVHWGFAIAKDSPLKPSWGTLGYSVTPSLVAWSALLLKPQYGLITVALGLLYALLKDLGTPYFPRWYHALRKILTTLAASSVLLTVTVFYLQ